MPPRFRGLTKGQLTLLAIYGSVETWWQWGDWVFEGVSPYQIEKRLRNGVGGVSGYGRSWIYTTTKKLAAEGYLHGEELEREEDDVEPGRGSRGPAVGGKTTVYTITKDGEAMLDAWLRTSCNVPEINDEAGVRLEVGHRSLDIVLEGLTSMRPALKTLLRRIDESEEKEKQEKQGQPGDPTVELRYGLYRSLTEARLKWLDQAERVLLKTIRERERAKRAAEKKRQQEDAAWVKGHRNR